MADEERDPEAQRPAGTEASAADDPPAEETSADEETPEAPSEDDKAAHPPPEDEDLSDAGDEADPEADEDDPDSDDDAEPEPEAPAPSGLARRGVGRAWRWIGKARLPLIVLAALGLGAAVGRMAGVSALEEQSDRAQSVPAGLAAPAARASRVPELPDEFAGLSYEDLLRSGDESLRASEYGSAVRLYRAAVVRARSDTARATVARYRCACALDGAGSHGRALEIIRSLRILGRPGDSLWRHCTMASLHLLAVQGRWDAFMRDLALLRANTDRYPERTRLNRWCGYRRVIARAQIALQAAGDATSRYGVVPGDLGCAGETWPELRLPDVPPAPAGLGDGSVTARMGARGLQLTASGAPVGAVLDAVRDAAGLEVAFSGPARLTVTARLLDSPPEEALEIVLGAVGYRVLLRDGRRCAEPAEAAAQPHDVLIADAQADLKRFLILQPESEHVPEAYYALAALYLSEGRVPLALDQLKVLVQDFPRSRWALLGRYITGRAHAERKEWARAERNLLGVLDADPRHPVAAHARLFAAECQMALKKYQPALAHFNRLLRGQPDDALAERLLYDIAFCMEQLDYPAEEVEARYAELKLRYSHGAYASLTDYRLARLAFEAGNYGAAVKRYRRYLDAWSLQGPHGPQVCRDLLRAWVQLNEPVRAIALGETLRLGLAEAGAPGTSAERLAAWRSTYREILPDLLDAAESAGLHQAALRYADQLMFRTAAPEERERLRLRRAEILAELGLWGEVEAILVRLEALPESSDVRHAACLVRARMLLHSRRDDAAMDLCRRVALASSGSKELCAKALEVMGAYYEQRGDFASAALVYAGRCPTGIPREAPNVKDGKP